MSDRANQEQLTQQVRGLLLQVLQKANFPGCDELMEQASSVSVVGGPIAMLELRSVNTFKASEFADGPIPLSMVVSNLSGDLVGELLVWVDGGYLSGLEFAWITDDAPVQLPEPDQIRVSAK